MLSLRNIFQNVTQITLHYDTNTVQQVNGQLRHLPQSLALPAPPGPNTEASPQPPRELGGLGVVWKGQQSRVRRVPRLEQTPAIPGKSQEKSNEGSKSAPSSEMNTTAKGLHILLQHGREHQISNISGDINDYVCSASRSENHLRCTK